MADELEGAVTKKVTNLDKAPQQKRKYTHAITGKPIKGMTDEKYADLKEQGHPLNLVKTEKIK